MNIIGVFNTFTEADAAYKTLQDNGIEQDDISVAMQESVYEEYKDADTEMTDDDVTDGAATGATLGGIAGLLVGATAITFPVVGPVITAGTIATVLGSTAVGAGGGALVGALVDMGIPEEQAQTYAKRLEEEGVLIAVETDDEEKANNVKELMAQAGADHVLTEL